MTSSAFETRCVYKTYDDRGIWAFRGVDLSIATGEYMAIPGPSGTGKSTLLHMLGGPDSPTGGEVLFGDLELCKSINLDTYRSRTVGFNVQAFHLIPTEILLADEPRGKLG
jgi:putative ABC transport system ATP-binding protein